MRGRVTRRILRKLDRPPRRDHREHRGVPRNAMAQSRKSTLWSQLALRARVSRRNGDDVGMALRVSPRTIPIGRKESKHASVDQKVNLRSLVRRWRDHRLCNE